MPRVMIKGGAWRNTEVSPCVGVNFTLCHIPLKQII